MIATAIKFCGLTRAADVELALDLGVDYLGLVLAENSPRRVTLGQAVELTGLIRRAATGARVVVLLRDADAGFVAEAIGSIAPDRLQFHGNEGELDCLAGGTPYWKALGMAGPAVDVAALTRQYPTAEALLLDGHAPGAAGGSGQRLDLARWPRIARRLILAGGLDPDNVAEAIRTVRPFAVDVSSGIESAPGVKDAVRMRAFVAAARAAFNRR